MKFIHTADWQIGMKAAHVGAVGDRVRSERLTAAKRVVTCAEQHGAEFMVVAGDTFEDNAVDRRLVQTIGDTLGGAEVPVYLIPGNHDPLVPGSVWKHPVWQSHANLHILKEAAPLKVPGGTLFPSPLFEKYSTSDPTAWIDATGMEEIAIGLAHGNVEGLPMSEPDYPIPRDAAARRGLDYLALGHWHSFGSIEDSDGAPRIAYSGTHETTKFGERDSGNVVLVEIPRRGAAPQLTPIRTGGLHWTTLEGQAARIIDEGDLTRLREQIEEMPQAGATLLRVELSGVLYANEADQLQRIDELIASRFLYGRVDAGALLPQPEDRSWLSQVPVGVAQAVAERLQALSKPDFVGERPAGATPQAATRALMELYRLTHEVPR